MRTFLCTRGSPLLFSITFKNPVQLHVMSACSTNRQPNRKGFGWNLQYAKRTMRTLSLVLHEMPARSRLSRQFSPFFIRSRFFTQPQLILLDVRPGNWHPISEKRTRSSSRISSIWLYPISAHIRHMKTTCPRNPVNLACSCSPHLACFVNLRSNVGTLCDAVTTQVFIRDGLNATLTIHCNLYAVVSASAKALQVNSFQAVLSSRAPLRCALFGALWHNSVLGDRDPTMTIIDSTLLPD
jgi:hypothetical protein